MITKNEIEILRNKGMTFSEIGQKLGYSKGYINIIFHDKYILKSGRNLKYRKSLNENCFSIQTPEADFWAGFIAADGNISKRNQIGIELHSQDISFLRDFKNWCGSLHKITTSKQFYIKGNRFRNSVAIRFTSKKMVEDLRKYYNITERKSLTLEPPNRQSLEFIAGLWVGDGGIGCNKDGKWWLSFTGTEEIIKWVHSYFVDLSNSKIYKNKSKKHSYQAKYSGNNLVLKVCNRLFLHSPFILERKYNKYLELLNGNI